MQWIEFFWENIAIFLRKKQIELRSMSMRNIMISFKFAVEIFASPTYVCSIIEYLSMFIFINPCCTMKYIKKILGSLCASKHITDCVMIDTVLSRAQNILWCKLSNLLIIMSSLKYTILSENIQIIFVLTLWLNA